MSITESDTLPVGKHATLNGVFKPSTMVLSINDQFVPIGRRRNNSIGSLCLMGGKIQTNGKWVNVSSNVHILPMGQTLANLATVSTVDSVQ